MEPDNIIWMSAVNYIIPFAFFFAGILVAWELDLLTGIRLRQALVMGVPVSLVVVTTSLMSASPAYQETVPKFLMLCGTLMFYGTLTPHFFATLRDRAVTHRPEFGTR